MVLVSARDENIESNEVAACIASFIDVAFDPFTELDFSTLSLFSSFPPSSFCLRLLICLLISSSRPLSCFTALLVISFSSLLIFSRVSIISIFSASRRVRSARARRALALSKAEGVFGSALISALGSTSLTVKSSAATLLSVTVLSLEKKVGPSLPSPSFDSTSELVVDTSIDEVSVLSLSSSSSSSFLLFRLNTFPNRLSFELLSTNELG
mmetsp:Transcript_23/g.57  ORF Transcript_23/g.57 Transcript_23/m.57 type:complete len:211 (+) Transcript_23:1979-2611(+)